MRKLAVLFLATLASLSSAAIAPYAIQSNQADSTATTLITTYINPIGGAFWLYFNPVTNQMEPATVGTGLSWSSGVLNCTVSAASRSFGGTARSLNSVFQVSALRDSFVAYSFQIQSTSTIAGGQSGRIILEQADDSGFTTNVITLGQVANGQTLGLAVALSITQPLEYQISAMVPAGKYVRARTVNVSGTPTFIFLISRETLL